MEKQPRPAPLQDDVNDLSPTDGAEPSKDYANVCLDGLYTDGELAGDRLIGPPLSNEADDLQLARR